MANNKFDTASIYLKPSGKKTGKLYAQKPHTGDADFVVTNGAGGSYIDENGVLVFTVANEPMIDFKNSTRPAILIEPTATNLNVYSKEYSTAAWLKAGAVAVDDVALSPSGDTDASTLIEDSSTGVHEIVRSVSLGGSVDSSRYAISIDVKQFGRSRIQIFDNNQNTAGATVFDLATGTVVSGTGVIETAEEGYYRCVIFPVKNFSTTSTVIVRLINTGTTTSYTGDGVSGVCLYESQWETGLATTSRKQTSGAAVTRVGDLITKTGISSYIGQTEGAIYADVDLRVFAQSGSPIVGILSLHAAADNLNNSIFIGVERNSSGVNSLFGAVIREGATQVEISGAAIVAGRFKLALSYAANNFSLFVNGLKIASDTSGLLPVGMSRVTLGRRYTNDPFVLNDRVSEAIVYKVAMSDSELELITTI